MKVLVTGVAGQLGYDVMKELEKRGIQKIGSDLPKDYSGDWLESYEAMDITDTTSVEEVFEKVQPDVVVHCAAWTAVDLAEEEENYEKVYAVNVTGTKNIAEQCKKFNSKMIYISTDYVFDGQGEQPWEPDCKDYNPISVYGKTKWEAEQMVESLLDKYFIVRIAWVFGKNGNNFVKTMLNIGKKFSELKVVCDQIGTPTYTYDLAKLLVDMLQTDKYGYYHATNEGGYISWYDFAVEIFKIGEELGETSYSSENLVVKPVTTEEYGVSKAKRPFNSRLDKSKLAEQGFGPLPHWKDALRRYITQLERE